MEDIEELDMLKFDVGRTALSCNANLVVVYNNKKMIFFYEHLQIAADKFPDKAMTLLMFCGIVDRKGTPCKKEDTGNSFSFVARGISKDEALAEY